MVDDLIGAIVAIVAVLGVLLLIGLAIALAYFPITLICYTAYKIFAMFHGALHA